MGRLIRIISLTLLFASPIVASAQAVKGSMLGNVSDTSGFVLPGVTVTLVIVAAIVLTTIPLCLALRASVAEPAQA